MTMRLLKRLDKCALRTQRSEIEQELLTLARVSDHVHQPVGTPKVDTAIAQHIISHIQNKPGNEKCIVLRKSHDAYC